MQVEVVEDIQLDDYDEVVEVVMEKHTELEMVLRERQIQVEVEVESHVQHLQLDILVVLES